MSKTIIGVDPGVNGGMCMVTHGYPMEVFSFSGKTVDEVCAAMVAWTRAAKERGAVSVYLEKVHSMPDNGHVQAFTFGKVYGGLLFGFKCMGLTVYHPTPQLWMEAMECMTGGDKLVTLRKAKAMWPDFFVGKTKAWGLSIADAMLIAEYGRRWEERTNGQH
jgi:hypothetical protein